MPTWPAGIPHWQETSLKDLAKAHDLYGIPAPMVARIELLTSDFGKKGLGYSTTGYGGYFGEKPSAVYKLPSGTVITPTSKAMLSSSTYTTQARISAGVVSEGLLQNSNTLQKALARYVKGGTTAKDIAASKTWIDYVMGNTKNVSPTLLTPFTAMTQPLQAAATKSAKLKGMGAVLYQINKFLNPKTPGGAFGGIEHSLTIIGTRGFVTVFSALIAGFGLYVIVNKGTVGNISSLGGMIQSQQRIGLSRQRIGIHQYTAVTRRARELRLSGVPAPTILNSMTGP